MAPENEVSVKSLRTATEIIQVLQDQDGAGVSGIANELDMPISTVHSHLTTLYELQYVDKTDKQYHVGLRFLDHGIYARNRVPVLEEAREPLTELASETGELAYLMIENHGEGVYLDEARGSHAVETRGRIGKRTGLHTVAAGKAILAYLDPERVVEIIERHGLPARTDHTITEKDELFDNLEMIRDREFAVNDNEDVPGLRAVGAPIVVDGDVLGSVSVSGPSKRFQGNHFEEELPNQVLSTINTIELQMQY